MDIKELKGNKKNCNLVLYLRKVVESYRAGFVEYSDEIGSSSILVKAVFLS